MKPTNEINEYLKRLKGGERCIDEFFAATSGYIRFIAYKYLVFKSFVDDVVNSTFCKVLDNIGKYNEHQNGKAWISKIAQNEAYAINNRERKHNYVSLEDVSEEIACTVDHSQSLEFVASLENALNKLDERDREIVELRVFEGWLFEEIANKFDMYVGTVYKRFQKSVKQINKELFK